MRTNKGARKMDELKVKLSTRFMRNIVSKLLSKLIYKKFGYKIDIRINELDIRMIDGDTNVSTHVELKLNNKEFNKIVHDVGLD